MQTALLLTWWLKDIEMGQTSQNRGNFKVIGAKATSLELVFTYLRKNIAQFVVELNGRGVSLIEDVITDSLVRFLNEELLKSNPKRNLQFFFHHQPLESNDGRSRKNDFAAIPVSGNQITKVILPNDLAAIVRFEAKRLDTKLEPAREKEYVIGEYPNGSKPKNSGGIERFKNKSHGSKDPNGALVAYIQTDDVATWLSKINNWIESEIAQSSDPNLNWDTQDKLSNRQNFSHHDEFKSTSARSPGLRVINLHHFWIPLNQVPAQNLQV
jgi:hypothetical protein